jgi:type IV pilus assembly protein PilB
MRILDISHALIEIDKLDFSEHNLQLVLKGIAQSHGIVFITGPTGSGKTTTLYSALTRLNHDEVNIVTVEDPVEYQMQGINQV